MDARPWRIRRDHLVRRKFGRRHTTMPIAIYIGFDLNLGVAIALSMMLIIVSIVLLTITKQLV